MIHHDNGLSHSDRLQCHLCPGYPHRDCVDAANYREHVTKITKQRDAARRELGEFKTAVERLCDEWERDYTDMPTWWGVDELRDLLTTAGSEGAL